MHYPPHKSLVTEKDFSTREFLFGLIMVLSFKNYDDLVLDSLESMGYYDSGVKKARIYPSSFPILTITRRSMYYCDISAYAVEKTKAYAILLGVCS